MGHVSVTSPEETPPGSLIIASWCLSSQRFHQARHCLVSCLALFPLTPTVAHRKGFPGTFPSPGVIGRQEAETDLRFTVLAAA